MRSRKTCESCGVPDDTHVVYRRGGTLWALDLDLAHEFPEVWGSPVWAWVSGKFCHRCLDIKRRNAKLSFIVHPEAPK